MWRLRFNFSQSYAAHSYLELSIPPGPNNTYSISPSHLHIWPRGEFMLIALPNLDRSFTLTLFAHQSTFEALDKQLEEHRYAAEAAAPIMKEGEEGEREVLVQGSETVNPVVKLFREEFADALELMGEEELMRSWTENPKDGLITVEVSLRCQGHAFRAMLMQLPRCRVQCSPYHFQDKVLLLGDAAHAMVPFYGQPMTRPLSPLPARPLTRYATLY